MVKNWSFVKKISLFLPVQSMAIFSSIKSYILENNSCDYFQIHHFLTFKHYKLIFKKNIFFSGESWMEVFGPQVQYAVTSQPENFLFMILQITKLLFYQTPEDF